MCLRRCCISLCPASNGWRRPYMQKQMVWFNPTNVCEWSSRLRNWLRVLDSDIPSSLFSTFWLNLVLEYRTTLAPLIFCHDFDQSRHAPSGLVRVYWVTQFRTDDVLYCTENPPTQGKSSTRYLLCNRSCLHGNQMDHLWCSNPGISSVDEGQSKHQTRDRR